MSMHKKGKANIEVKEIFLADENFDLRLVESIRKLRHTVH